MEIPVRIRQTGEGVSPRNVDSYPARLVSIEPEPTWHTLLLRWFEKLLVSVRRLLDSFESL
jgi:hypothetical protein